MLLYSVAPTLSIHSSWFLLLFLLFPVHVYEPPIAAAFSLMATLVTVDIVAGLLSVFPLIATVVSCWMNTFPCVLPNQLGHSHNMRLLSFHDATRL